MYTAGWEGGWLWGKDKVKGIRFQHRNRNEETTRHLQVFAITLDFAIETSIEESYPSAHRDPPV